MRHPFMAGVSERLAARGLGTLRYQFPYVELGNKRPDSPGVLTATVRAAVARAAEEDLPLFAGGKSLGGRMTSTAASSAELPGLRGIVFFGFPLHAPGRASAERGEHLARVEVPMLFLQGTRDSLADLAFLMPVVEALGDRATLHVVEGGDHSFHVPKRSGRSDEEVLDELAEATASWARGFLP
jgi:predicted alpha/beta-hydrolase family hydrolase